MPVTALNLSLWIGGGIIALLGVVILARALFADPPRGRRRCPRCWYPTDGLNTLTCPECGHTARSNAAQIRSRRYWWRALAGVILTGSGFAASLTPSVRHKGWLSLAPTDALLVYLEFAAPNDSHRLDQELRRRLLWNEVWPWNAGRVYLRIAGGGLVRTRWPEGVPITVPWSLSQQAAPITDPDTLSGPFRPTSVNFELEKLQDLAEYSYRGISPFSGRAILKDLTALEGTVEVSHPPGFPKEHSFVRWRIPLDIGGTLEEVIRPVSGPEVDRAVRDSISVQLVAWESDAASLQINHKVADGWHRQYPRMVVGLIAEVRFGDEIVARGQLVFPRPGPPPARTLLEGDLARLHTADLRDPRWTIRLIGDGVTALGHPTATEYWKGQIDLPAWKGP